MLKKSPLKLNFVEEEILVDVRFVSETGGLKILVDSGAPLSVVSEKWMKKYINEKVVDEKELEYRNCVRRVRFGENVYLSTKEVKFPLIVKVEDGDYIKREVVANIVEKEEELFLCGRTTLQEWKAAVFFDENRL